MGRRSFIRGLLIVLYVVFALYFLNYPFGFFTVPEGVFQIEQWIIFVGGILLVIGCFSYIRVRRGKIYY